jgi:hypothetical protein
MHFEMLIEDRSGELLLDSLLPKILGANGESHSWRTHAYKGIGRVPLNLRGKTDPWKRVLLNQLPRVLAGYGKSLQGQNAAVVVVVDADDRDCVQFKQELVQLLDSCHPRPRALFRLAIEEVEAWILGDRCAVVQALPRAKANVLNSYAQDSVCGTWELLADAVFSGGAAKLKAEGYPRIGEEKCKWATLIGPRIDPERNLSPSFQAFRSGLLSLSTAGE